MARGALTYSLCCSPGVACGLSWAVCRVWARINSDIAFLRLILGTRVPSRKRVPQPRAASKARGFAREVWFRSHGCGTAQARSAHLLYGKRLLAGALGVLIGIVSLAVDPGHRYRGHRASSLVTVSKRQPRKRFQKNR